MAGQLLTKMGVSLDQFEYTFGWMDVDRERDVHRDILIILQQLKAKEGRGPFLSSGVSGSHMAISWRRPL